jgi:hypothetical protein
MNKHLAKAIEIYGEDLQQLLAWHLCHGIVVCDLDCFAIGFESEHSKPTEAIELGQRDTLFVTFCAGDMQSGLSKYIQDYEFIAFNRDFKKEGDLKMYDMYKLYSKLK